MLEAELIMEKMLGILFRDCGVGQSVKLAGGRNYLRKIVYVYVIV